MARVKTKEDELLDELLKDYTGPKQILDEKVLVLYSGGLSTREIQVQLEAL